MTSPFFLPSVFGRLIAYCTVPKHLNQQQQVSRGTEEQTKRGREEERKREREGESTGGRGVGCAYVLHASDSMQVTATERGP
eukprot:2174735-Rhodomonas_salina.1